MIATLDEIKHKEHLLAEKAENILQHQHDLQSLEGQLEDLRENRPTTDKDQLTYEESIEFGKKVENYEGELNHIELQIQKLNRELTALEHQAQRLLPVSGVRVKVSTYSDEGEPTSTFCIQYLEETTGQSEGKFKIERLPKEQ